MRWGRIDLLCFPSELPTVSAPKQVSPEPVHLPEKRQQVPLLNATVKLVEFLFIVSYRKVMPGSALLGNRHFLVFMAFAFWSRHQECNTRSVTPGV